MKYNKVISANFIERPNRFIAYVDIAGRRTKVHVKNTGRCRELLQDNAQVYLEESDNKARSTAYDLVAVDKAGRLVNIDSNAPNKAVGEWLMAGGLYRDVSLVRPETTFENSRFDFYVESASGKKAFIEVKGVTLERDNIAVFPDAPSMRALKHVEELIHAHEQGYDAYLVFVVQLKGIRYVEPNWDTQPAFGELLRKARAAGVRLLAYDCKVGKDSLTIDEEVQVVIPASNESKSCLHDLDDCREGCCVPVAHVQHRPERSVDRIPRPLGCFKSDAPLLAAGYLADGLDQIAKPLLTWYDAGRRILPWREEATPYHVWLSEIMLQQTRVEAVKPYYDRFLKELPDIKSLAEVEEERLLKLWEGLGYYNRARNLKKTAMTIVSEYKGEMPDTYETLLTLAGIGSYTAGAIASIAFGRPVPAVDGNVLRVLSRLRLDDRDITDAKVKKEIEEEVKGVIPKERPGDFNQALIELGAVVCIPNGTPKCDECPLRELCRARALGRIAEFPKKAPKKARSIEKKTILVIQDADLVALRKRPNRGLLAGMYEFPALDGHRSEKQVLAYLRELGLQPIRIKKLDAARHIFTHKEWHMTGYAVRVDELDKSRCGQGKNDLIFIDPAETKGRYPIPSAFAVYADYMEMKRGV